MDANGKKPEQCKKCHREINAKGSKPHHPWAKGWKRGLCHACYSLPGLHSSKQLESEPVARTCPRCKRDLPAGAFHKNKSTSHGLHPYCKKCTKELRLIKPKKRDATKRTDWILNQLRGNDY